MVIATSIGPEDELQYYNSEIRSLESERDAKIREIEIELRGRYRYSWKDVGQRLFSDAADEIRKMYAPQIADLDLKRQRVIQEMQVKGRGHVKGVEIHARNIISDGQIISEGEGAYTRVFTQSYRGKGKVIARTRGILFGKKLLEHPLIAGVILLILGGLLSIKTSRQCIAFSNQGRKCDVYEVSADLGILGNWKFNWPR